MVLLTDSGDDYLTEVVILELSLRQRLSRSLSIFLICIMGALVMVPIPVVHLFLVPGLLLAAITMASLRFTQRYCVDMTGQGCPLCHADFNEKKKYFSDRGHRIYCTNCRRSWRISF